MGQQRIGKATLIAVAICLLGGAAQARQDGEDRQVRVACQLQPTGRLEDCTVLSRLGADESFDLATVEAARTARAWPIPAEAALGPIHFPIEFEVLAGQQLERASPLRLRVRRPGEDIAPDDSTAASPPAPAGFEGRAWGGLHCVVSEARQIKTCWPDYREATPGALAGKLVYFVPVSTLSGETVDLPDAMPASLEQIRDTWTPGGRVDELDYFLKEVSRSGGVHLTWTAEVGEDTVYWLTEFDCPNRRARGILRIVQTSDGAPTHTWHPDDWFPIGDEEDSTENALTPDDVVCGTGA